jgi:hypothetical protein
MAVYDARRGTTMNTFVIVENERKGPYSEKELRVELAAGRIKASQLAWCEGHQTWKSLADILGDAVSLSRSKPLKESSDVLNMNVPPLQIPDNSGSSTSTLQTHFSSDTIHCRNCGKQLSCKAVACPGCGCEPRSQRNFCCRCGKPTLPIQIICTQCGVSLIQNEKTKSTAGIFGILLGAFGAHKFYLGYKRQALFVLITPFAAGLALALFNLLCGIIAAGGGDFRWDYVFWLLLSTYFLGWVIGTGVMQLLGCIEGIKYLTMSDENFAAVYVHSRKCWF